MINENILKNDLFVNVHKEHFEDFQTGGKGTYYSQKDVFDCIDNQPKIGGWIPCSERLPEEHEEVICCFKSGVVKALVLFSCKFHGKVYAYEKSDIIAWQPLPEAYHG